MAWTGLSAFFRRNGPSEMIRLVITTVVAYLLVYWLAGSLTWEGLAVTLTACLGMTGLFLVSHTIVLRQDKRKSEKKRYQDDLSDPNNSL